jgi:shikimate kinase
MPQKLNSQDLNQRIYLLGMPGSGKSTEGAKLAKSLGWNFIDLDKAIEIETGISISNIFEMHGEMGFRKMEQTMLMKTFSATHIVIACGGGTACFENNMELIKQHGLSIYLKANAPFLLSRLMGKIEERPMFNGLKEVELLEKIKDLLQLRESFYYQANGTLELPVKDNKALFNKALSLLNKP